jgi:DNA-binding response OmpR family regulator
MKKILIVEDDRFLAKAYEYAFESESEYEIQLAYDGEEALSKLDSKELPDLVLLDLILPKKDGFEVLETIRSTSRLKKLKVIIASNLGSEKEINRARKLGVDTYIVKSETSVHDVLESMKKAVE